MESVIGVLDRPVGSGGDRLGSFRSRSRTRSASRLRVSGRVWLLATGLCGWGAMCLASGCDEAGPASKVDVGASAIAGTCGDGVVDPGEGCDQGPANSDTTPDACRKGCVPAGCGDGVFDSVDVCDVRLKHQNTTPTRLARAPDGRIWVTDAGRHAVFAYLPHPAGGGLKPVAEIGGLATPLGVAVDAQGLVYVGNDGRDNVEVFSAAGERGRVIGAGTLSRPNDLMIGPAGALYVVDSDLELVRVFTREGQKLRDIGDLPGEKDDLSFPVAIAARCEPGSTQACELFVADQGNTRVRVYDLQGHHLRDIGSRPPANVAVDGTFVRLQALSFDAKGRLHVLDSYLHRIQLLDPKSGSFMGRYGVFGKSMGQLNLPLDLEMLPDGRALVANTDNHRVEVLDVHID